VVLAYFTHLKCQKCIGDDVGDFKYITGITTKTKKILFVKKQHNFPNVTFTLDGI
jgi:hypothetical protein